MHRLLLSILFVPVGAWGALAADRVEAAHRADRAESFSWSGGYVGVHGGYGWAKGAWEFDPAFALGTSDPRFGGFFIGAHAGAQHQFENNVVLGLEMDIRKYEADSSDTIVSFGEVVPIALETQLNWAASARLRAGYALDRWMPYVTGGVAIADYDAVGSVVPFSVATPDSELAIGWTAGAGAEYALTDNVLLRGEYRYSDFGTDDRSALGLPDSYRLSTHEVTLGVSYKF